MFGLDLVFSRLDVYHFMDVQAFNKVFGDNVRSSDDYIIDIFDSQCHQKTLLKTLEWGIGASVILDH